jgi:CheY-like chemotaxis protein
MTDVFASVISASPTPQPSFVLIVEDNDINREVARAILEAAGHRVELVENGEEAVAAVQEREFDVVLMDIQMPVLDGVAATRQIRALAHPASAVPIIAMTASSLPHQVSAYFGAGMNGHVGKPFKRDELVAAVVRWSRRVAAEPPAPALLDLPTYEGVVAMLGAEKSQVLLDALAQKLAQVPTDIARPLDRQLLARDAHAIVSSAGLLGFAALSDLARKIEAAYEAGIDLAPLMVRLTEMRTLVVAEIERRREKARSPA